MGQNDREDEPQRAIESPREVLSSTSPIVHKLVAAVFNKLPVRNELLLMSSRKVAGRRPYKYDRG